MAAGFWRDLCILWRDTRGCCSRAPSMHKYKHSQVCTPTDNHTSIKSKCVALLQCSSRTPNSHSTMCTANQPPQSWQLACSSSAACATGTAVGNQQHSRNQNQKPRNKGLAVALNGIHAMYRVAPCFTIRALGPPHLIQHSAQTGVGFLGAK